MTSSAPRSILVLALSVLALPALWACRTFGPDADPGTPEAAKDATEAVTDATPGLTPGEVLDDWHAAAAEADEARYLGHFTADAVFLGTDASERWTLAEFSEYVREYFPRGGWTYHPHDRHVMRSAAGTVAWFDEGLTHGDYGELRGTGVLRLEEGRWRLAHYNMAFTIPNDVAREVVRVVAEGGE